MTQDHAAMNMYKCISKNFFFDKKSCRNVLKMIELWLMLQFSS